MGVFFNQTSPEKIEDIDDSYCSEAKYPCGLVPYYGQSNIGSEGIPTSAVVAEINCFLEWNSILKREIIEVFEQEACELDLSNCVGVHIRGTDMQIAGGHNRPIWLEKNIKIVSETFQKTKLKKIFLCSDEKNIVERAKEQFGNVLIFPNSYRSSGGNRGIHLEKSSDKIRKGHHYLLGLEVLRDAYLLSRCHVFVCGRYNVAYASFLILLRQLKKLHALSLRYYAKRNTFSCRSNNNKFENIIYTN